PEALALLTNRTSTAGDPMVWVCHNFQCELPVTTAESLEKLL
ncbi:MAG: hypothetical protein RIR52_649, partial [Acidobacteriota bacterium]